MAAEPAFRPASASVSSLLKLRKTGRASLSGDGDRHIERSVERGQPWHCLSCREIEPSYGLSGPSLITPNRKEAFELAKIPDETHNSNPLADANLMRVAERLLDDLRPALLLVTLGDLGMLLCQRGHKPFHIPTVSQEVFDVSGAGDTVIAIFTLAIAAGASPLDAAILSNHAAGIVVGKLGTATVSPEELAASLSR